MSAIVAAPGARIDLENDWSAFLPSGDSRDSGNWTIHPDELAPGDTMLENPTEAKVWIKEGTLVNGKTYVLEEKITSADGRTPGARGFTIIVGNQL